MARNKVLHEMIQMRDDTIARLSKRLSAMRSIINENRRLRKENETLRPRVSDWICETCRMERSEPLDTFESLYCPCCKTMLMPKWYFMLSQQRRDLERLYKELDRQ